MKLIVLVAWIAIAAAVVVGQEVPSVIVKGNCPNDLPEYKQWFVRTPLLDGGQYVAEDSRKEVVSGYSKLKLNMAARQVGDLLGKPDFAVSLYPARLSTAPPPANVKCPNEVAYVLRKKSENMADTSDVAVYLFFTADDKLYWAQPQNIPSLKAIGAPTGKL